MENKTNYRYEIAFTTNKDIERKDMDNICEFVSSVVDEKADWICVPVFPINEYPRLSYEEVQPVREMQEECEIPY